MKPIGRPIPITMRHWLIGAVGCAGLVLLSIAIVDQPLTRLAARYGLATSTTANLPVEFPLMPILSLAAILFGSIVTIRRKPVPEWIEAAYIAGIATALTLCLVEFILKPLFGRSGPWEYLDSGRYAFNWFHGRIYRYGVFPSGHTAQAAACLTVLWCHYPRLHWLWASALVLLGTVLVAGLWHFASDVVAGAYIGAFIGVGTQTVRNILTRQRVHVRR